jgi:ribosome-binding protein aMBF1 (putative translation factor)
MSVESIEQVIKRWETGEITPEQVIGKILLWLLELYRRLLKLEAKRPGSNESR